GFTYPHQNLFAVYEKDGNFQVSSFEYGHFRETGNPLDDILFHTNHSPSRKAYGLYNTRIESLSPEYQSKVQMQLFKSKNQRLRQAKQNLSDYQNARGFFTSSKIKVVQSFLKKYSLEENYLNKIDPSEFSYLQKLFPKNRAVIVAKAFEESVLIDDYYKNKKMNSGNKHMPIEFFLKDQLLYFPAIYSESLAPESPLSGLSIITMPPRPEVLEAGHDRSPICLNKNAALEYLNSELNLKDYPNFFKENLIANKLENKPKAIDAI
ncbi:MAG: SOS response-associated peptidase family protein, partial [Bdellovibrionota bacterium]|nr:SOS response-associated peptidase family protein [Bdellovibrionota bacterium]